MSICHCHENRLVINLLFQGPMHVINACKPVLGHMQIYQIFIVLFIVLFVNVCISVNEQGINQCIKLIITYVYTHEVGNYLFKYAVHATLRRWLNRV